MLLKINTKRNTKMETQEQITRFKKIIENEYHDYLLELLRNGKKAFILDFEHIARMDLDLADDILENPEDTIKAAGIAACQFDLPNIKLPDELIARIKNLPKSQKKKIRNLRSKHLDKMICIEGIIRQKGEIRPQVTSSRFECPSCGNIIPVLQLDSKFKEPSICGCGRKGKFKMLSKDLIDAQNIKVEEDIETLEGGEQPKRLNVFMKEDLITPMLEKRAYPGSKIRINGFLKETPVILKGGGKSTRFDWIFEANYFEPVDEEFGEVKITDEEKEEIKKLAKDPEILPRLIKSVAPSIYGLQRIKEAILVQLVGGVKKEIADAGTTRADMHILLIGDPGIAKTRFLKRINIIAPKSRFVSGKGASGAGLTAAAVKDEFMGGWTLEAGAMVLANKGILCIDELDKMSKEDTSAMHEALEGQTIPVSKANIQATLRCETTVLAAANPKFGRFDLYGKSIATQFELPQPLINRFDLIFPVKDIPDLKRDDALAKFVSGVHRKANGNGNKKQSTKKTTNEKTNDIIDTKFLRKYIAYVKNKRPVITDEAESEYVGYYLKMRQSGSTDSGLKTVPISARQLEALIRMAEAFAKIRLSDTVDKEDAKKRS